MYPQGQRVQVIREVNNAHRATRHASALVLSDTGGDLLNVQFANGTECEVLRETIVTEEDGIPREFYVSVKDGDRTGFLLGPYPTKEAADAQVTQAKKLANDADPFACFYGFGVSATRRGANLRTVFGP